MHYNKNCFLFVRQVLQLFDRALAAAHFNSQELLTSKLHPVDCVHVRERVTFSVCPIRHTLQLTLMLLTHTRMSSSVSTQVQTHDGAHLPRYQPCMYKNPELSDYRHAVAQLAFSDTRHRHRTNMLVPSISSLLRC